MLIRAILLSLAVFSGVSEAAGPPLLLQKPAISETQIAFAFAGDLWIVGREGGDARRLTTSPGNETDPAFSPDGSLIAFSGEYDGNVDVFVVPAVGGIPRRLTSHPSPDSPTAWTPDGKSIVFRSYRTARAGYRSLFTVSVNGGNAEELPLPMGIQASYSPDGSRIAFVPIGDNRPPNVYDAWKRYRGGRTSPVWVANLSDSSIVKVPRENSNDTCPMWIGNQIFFLSDRGGPVTLYSWDVGAKAAFEVLKNTGLDLKWASAGPGAIVYEQFGKIHVYDPKSRKADAVNIRVSGDFPEARAQYKKVAREIVSWSVSPSGARAAAEAHGEILTVPGEKGDIRNITNSPGTMERSPAWSPDGKRIAYFSDETGEYALHIRGQSGLGEVAKFNIGEGTSFFYAAAWSPDSKKIAYTDNKLNLWCLNLETGKSQRVDSDTYYSPFRTLDPSWSADSQWIAYTKQMKSYLRAVFVYSLGDGKSHQVTDGMSDARYAVFDKDGKHLYFTASTNSGLTPGWIDMSSSERPVTRNVYVAVLRKDLPSPLAPESDEEGAAKPEEKKDAKADAGKEAVEVRIDFDRMSQRILAMPIPSKNYSFLAAGKPGVLFLLEQDALGERSDGTLERFEWKSRKVEKVADGINEFEVSADGEKLFYRKGEKAFLTAVAAPAKPGDGELKLDSMEVLVDPPAEWRQMYNEVWRLERDYFYDAKLHGLNLADMKAKYAKYLDGLAARVDLNYLFQEMLGNITVGHLYIRGGSIPDVKKVAVGLLGADYRVENGRYRFARVYDGENWNPDAKAPLTQPGVNVAAGEYLLSVNGREVRGTDDVHSFFQASAGKSVVLQVGPNPDASGSRQVTVVPVPSEQQLRYLAWIEDNRRKVDAMSGGRLAYVHLPNTAEAGYRSFNRFLLGQVGREGAVIDERFNGGGQAADYVVDYLRRPLLNFWTTRYGADITTPVMAIFGPKAMIINEFAGSGGDAMPWYFRKLGIGPLVGKRTWGGLVGILGFPSLMDGGSVTAPNFAFWSPKGDWDVENYGVAPDVEVELDPKAVREGHDPQLERAVHVVLESLDKNPLPKYRKPAYPDHQGGSERVR